MCFAELPPKVLFSFAYGLFLLLNQNTFSKAFSDSLFERNRAENRGSGVTLGAKNNAMTMQQQRKDNATKSQNILGESLFEYIFLLIF